MGTGGRRGEGSWDWRSWREKRRSGAVVVMLLRLTVLARASEPEPNGLTPILPVAVRSGADADADAAGLGT